MLEELKFNLDELVKILFEVGYYQLSKQSQAKAQSKSSNQNFAETWINNEIFSEVDLWSEKRLIEFFDSRFHSSDFSFITEEYHAKRRQNSKYYVVIDPLDGTKPYLKGENTFGISLGICTEDKFLFGCNYYPAFNQLMYSFYDVEGVYNQYHKQIIPPKAWASNCSVTSQFSYLVKDSSVMEDFLESELGLTFVVVPDCATYRFKLMLEGLLAAYFSESLFIWDIGPSSLLMEKVGISMVNPLAHSTVAVSDLLTPPFIQPIFLAAPQNKINDISEKFLNFFGGKASAIEAR
jgi:fructose-1,6-bisphosphatase/inositol monophosphatase family enzyme